MIKKNHSQYNLMILLMLNYNCNKINKLYLIFKNFYSLRGSPSKLELIYVVLN